MTLLAGLGVEGDAHCGATVKHRSRVAIDPTQPNLRQVHLLPVEILEDLVVAAHTDAKGKAEAIVAEKTKELTAGLPIPPGFASSCF